MDATPHAVESYFFDFPAPTTPSTPPTSPPQLPDPITHVWITTDWSRTGWRWTGSRWLRFSTALDDPILSGTAPASAMVGAGTGPFDEEA
jgi:hypothetical protein